jgi:hypothetical protein
MIFFQALFVMPSRADEIDVGLCMEREVEVAGCVFDEVKSKQFSFCASADGERVNYRFGHSPDFEMEHIFSAKKPLLRWVDKATYTTYFGFRIGEYGYSFGVPQQTFGAKAFMEVTQKNVTVMERECTQNSFGEENLSNESIMDVDDEKIRNNGFVFPP